MPLENNCVRIDAGDHPGCQEKAARLRNSPVGANLVVVSRWRRMRSAAGVELAADIGRYGLQCEFILCCGEMGEELRACGSGLAARRSDVALVIVTATAERSPVGKLAIALGVSSAWMCDFSSTTRTMASRGGMQQVRKIKALQRQGRKCKRPSSRAPSTARKFMIIKDLSELKADGGYRQLQGDDIFGAPRRVQTKQSGCRLAAVSTRNEISL